MSDEHENATAEAVARGIQTATARLRSLGIDAAALGGASAPEPHLTDADRRLLSDEGRAATLLVDEGLRADTMSALRAAEVLAANPWDGGRVRGHLESEVSMRLQQHHNLPTLDEAYDANRTPAGFGVARVAAYVDTQSDRAALRESAHRLRARPERAAALMDAFDRELTADNTFADHDNPNERDNRSPQAVIARDQIAQRDRILASAGVSYEDYRSYADSRLDELMTGAAAPRSRWSADVSAAVDEAAAVAATPTERWAPGQASHQMNSVPARTTTKGHDHGR